MSLSAAAFSGLEAVLNRLLALDPEALDRLAELQGRIIRFDVLGLGLRFFIVPGPMGVQLLGRVEGDADCTLTGSPLAFIRMGSTRANTEQLFSGSVKIQGDTELGHSFGNILARLDVDWEEQLSHITGDVAAHAFGNQVRSFTSWGDRTLNNLGMNLQEYLQEERRLLPAQPEIEAFLADVDTLRDDSERLLARVSRLRHRITPKSKLGSTQ